MLEKVRVGLEEGERDINAHQMTARCLCTATALGALSCTPSHAFSIDGTLRSTIAPQLLRNQDTIPNCTGKQCPTCSALLYSVCAFVSQGCYIPEFVKLVDLPARTAGHCDGCHAQRGSSESATSGDKST